MNALPFAGRARAATPLHVAGVGASAGGLEAMLPLFAHLQTTGRIAYVVAQHMARGGHDELLVRLIQRESALPVTLGEDGARLAADRVYVVPSGKDGRIADHAGAIQLQLSEPDGSSVSTPSVNVLFASIAAANGQRAIGIVLSGAGYDGATGCRAIRNAGGLTVAQEPSEAKYDGMPRAAIDAGAVDRILPVGRIGDFLAGTRPSAAAEAPGHVPGGVPGGVPAEAALDELQTLLRQVRDATGIDFSGYKEETLLRRLDKRKLELGVTSAEAYQSLIRRQPDELKVLQQLFLVSVSSFFRDRESFRVLERELAGLLAARRADEPIRVWVAGCAGGEEAYTIAIILDVLLAGRHPAPAVDIVASDLNPEALALAAAGVYRRTAFAEMEAPLRERYLLARGEHFELRPEIRERVRFERRDVPSGVPPAVGEFDLVSCRNLLIYLKTDLQDRLLNSFQQALRSRGLLFIGQSESLGFVGNSLFAPVDHYHRLFRRRH